MNRHLLILLILLLKTNLFAQTNLVPNPSFEVLDSCPNSMAQIDKATGWAPFTSSPDLFHTCADFSSVFSVQCPATGNAFAGMFTYLSNSYEIIGIELIDSLIIGTKYYISLKVNLANNADCGIDKLGARFSTKKYCYSLNDTTNLCDSTPAPINNFAHIYSTQIITDTINWTKISGSFVADSNYKYIMIGHLFDTSATNFFPFPPNLDCGGGVYYFIDDICVSTDSITCVDITRDIIDFSADSTTIQKGSCINFNVSTVVDYDFYDWQFPGATPNTLTDSMPTNICYDTAGIFSVMLIASDSNGCGDIILKNNYITVLPCTNPVALYGYSDSLLTVNFSDSSTSAMSWLWNFGDGDTSISQNPVHTYTNGGTYNVCLITFNTCGTDTFCQSINVTDVGMQEYGLIQNINVYPIPTFGTVYVETSTGAKDINRFSVYNVLGILVYKGTVENRQIDLSGLSGGLYLLQVEVGEIVFRKRVIKL